MLLGPNSCDAAKYHQWKDFFKVADGVDHIPQVSPASMLVPLVMLLLPLPVLLSPLLSADGIFRGWANTSSQGAAS